MEFYYSVPFQVRFFYKNEYRTGLAFHEYIIDLGNGTIHTTREIVESAQALGIDQDYVIVERVGWIPIQLHI